MVTLPLVIVLGLLAFGLVKWGKQKMSGVVVGILFGLALATTAVGPPILSAVSAAAKTVVAAISSAVRCGCLAGRVAERAPDDMQRAS